MKPARVLVLVLLLLLLGVAHADHERDQLEHDLIDAIARRDTAWVAQHAHATLIATNLWFDAPKCRPLAGGNARITARELPLLVECLAKLGIHDRTASGMLTYGPGVPLRLAIAPGPNGLELAFLSSTLVAADAATIEPAIFQTHLRGFTREVVPDAATQRGIDAAGNALAYAQLVVCLDRTGAVDAVTVIDSSGVFPDYGEQAARAARAWKGSPFVVDKQRVRACSSFYVGYPAKALHFIDMLPP